MLGGPPSQAFPIIHQQPHQQPHMVLPRAAAPAMAAPRPAALAAPVPLASAPAASAWPQPAPLARQPMAQHPGQPSPVVNNPAPATALALNQPRPRVRMQGPDAPPPQASPPALVMPSPERLGIMPTGLASAPAATPSGDVDWDELHSRFRELGAVGFHLDRVTGGNWRATLLVPDAAANTPRRVEALAASEAAAVAGVLAQVQSR